MNGYLGEFEKAVPVFPKAQWALYFIEQYGQIDGDHHKAWVLDQVARILNGASISCKEARWENGHKELRMTIGTSNEYEEWVDEMTEEGYDYYRGIAP